MAEAPEMVVIETKTNKPQQHVHDPGVVTPPEHASPAEPLSRDPLLLTTIIATVDLDGPPPVASKVVALSPEAIVLKPAADTVKPTKQKNPKPKPPKNKTVKPKPAKVKGEKARTGKAKPAAKPGTAGGEKPEPPLDLGDSEWYLNRELTWLEFNRRVLHEATDERTPLLERLKFIAIVSANLDEFSMKRIGGLKQQIGAGINEPALDGRTPRQQVMECQAAMRDLDARKLEAFRTVRALLEQKGIVIESYHTLSPKHKKRLHEHYYSNIYPLLTPQSIDPAHPFPFISNLSTNLLVTLRYPKSGELSLARVKVPVGLGSPRFIRVGKGDHFVPLEEVMMENLDTLFPGMRIVACEIFRVTRNANTEKDEERADDLMEMIESELKERKFAPIVRLEIGAGMVPLHRGQLAAELELDEENDVFEVPEMLAMRDLFELARLDYPRLHDPPHHPIDHPLLTSRNIFHTIRDAGSLLLQHPYISFSTSVERFLRDAANDPKVLAIKMTLYRTSSQSRIVESLVEAAQNGKQVAVVVELKARFDEAANIRFAELMEEAGIHVTYGIIGLKTHCKVILVVRQDYAGLRRYVHIGTGNYNAETARIYSDVGLMTCDNTIAQDITELFNYLTTGFSAKRTYQTVIPAPKFLKKALLTRIEREIALHNQEKGGGLIQFKMNALEDGDIVKALYRASMAGVKVDLYVRDTCRLRPGIPGLSENIRVVSVVGRFLEHSRIYYFRNGGQEEYFISSADAMKRNLEARVEIMCPVTLPELTAELRTIFDCHDADHRSAWDMQPDGSYLQRRPAEGESAEGLHQMLIVQAAKRLKEAAKKRAKKVELGFSPRSTAE